jgi:2-keto-4-pentenoate hydratase
LGYEHDKNHRRTVNTAPKKLADRSAALAIAQSFVAARQRATALHFFPGDLPADLAAGYACQDEAIALWPDQIAGWKVGFIATDRRDASADDRVIGPIFCKNVWHAKPNFAAQFPVFSGGFSAVEAEYVFRLDSDAPVNKVDWSEADTLALSLRLYVGVEIAGSPLATINELGPAVVAADFGNNAGLILGQEIINWQSLSLSSLTCETWIQNTRVGSGGAASIPGGIVGALSFALGRCAQRGYPLRAGQLISTGAATGIHDIRAGESAKITFGAFGEIECYAQDAALFALREKGIA